MRKKITVDGAAQAYRMRYRGGPKGRGDVHGPRAPGFFANNPSGSRQKNAGSEVGQGAVSNEEFTRNVIEPSLKPEQLADLP